MALSSAWSPIRSRSSTYVCVCVCVCVQIQRESGVIVLIHAIIFGTLWLSLMLEITQKTSHASSHATSSRFYSIVWPDDYLDDWQRCRAIVNECKYLDVRLNCSYRSFHQMNRLHKMQGQ